MKEIKTDDNKICISLRKLDLEKVFGGDNVPLNLIIRRAGKEVEASIWSADNLLSNYLTCSLNDLPRKLTSKREPLVKDLIDIFGGELPTKIEKKLRGGSLEAQKRWMNDTHTFVNSDLINQIDYDSKGKLILPMYGLTEYGDRLYLTESTFVNLKNGSRALCVVVEETDAPGTDIANGANTAKGALVRYGDNNLFQFGGDEATAPTPDMPWLMRPDVLKTIHEETGDNPEEEIKTIYYELLRLIPEHIWMPDERWYKFIAAYIIATYYTDCFDYNPILVITGDYGSGKSRLTQFLETFCYHGMINIDPTEAFIYRVKESYKPTLIIDENQNANMNDYAHIIKEFINASYSKRGNTVYRLKKVDINGTELYQPVGYKLYSPFILAGIGVESKIAIDTYSRVILLKMYRKTSKFFKNIQKTEYQKLRDDLYYIRLRLWYDIYKLYKENFNGKKFPELTDRHRELWMGVLTILEYINEDNTDILELIKINDMTRKSDTETLDIKLIIYQSVASAIIKSKNDLDFFHREHADGIEFTIQDLYHISQSLGYWKTLEKFGIDFKIAGESRTGKHPKRRIATRHINIKLWDELCRESYGLGLQSTDDKDSILGIIPESSENNISSNPQENPSYPSHHSLGGSQ